VHTHSTVCDVKVHLSVCLSVRLSVTFVYCIETAEPISCQSVLCYIMAVQFSCTEDLDESPVDCLTNTSGLWKICNFCLVSRKWRTMFTIKCK